jgi:hypothetical protein
MPAHNYRGHSDFYGRIGGNEEHEFATSQMYSVIPRVMDHYGDQAQLFSHQDWNGPSVCHEVEFKHFHPLSMNE